MRVTGVPSDSLLDTSKQTDQAADGHPALSVVAVTPPVQVDFQTVTGSGVAAALPRVVLDGFSHQHVLITCY